MIILNTQYKANLTAAFANAKTAQTQIITIYNDVIDSATLNVATPPTTGRLIEYNGVGLIYRNGFVAIGGFSATAQNAKATATRNCKIFSS